MGTVKIKDCPCCGQPGKLKSDRVKTIGGSFLRGWVGCPACSLYIQWARDPEGAVAKWNRRAAPAKPYDLLYEEGGPDA